MSRNHAKLLEQARAAGLSEDELDVMAEELQHDPGAEETEDERELIPKIAPIKRKRQAPKSKKFVEENTRVFCYSTTWHIFVLNCYLTAPPEPTKVVTYLLSITSASESKKKVNQRESLSRRIELPLSEPWDTVKAQFLREINDALSPDQIHFDHYDILFKIPRIVSEPTRLVSDGDYDFLIRESTKGRTVANVKVQITQKKITAKVNILFCPTDSGTDCACTAWAIIEGFEEEGEGE